MAQQAVRGPGPQLASARVPLLYQRRARRWFIEIIYVVLTALAVAYVVSALGNREYGFGFLPQPAAFDIGNQWLVDFDGTTSSRLTMYLVGVWSTIRVVAVAIALATVVGVVVGVARLSQNWLVAKSAMLFVETFRNTPLYVQAVIWYAILLFGLPGIESVVNIGDSFLLSNRGVAIPWPDTRAGLWGGPEWLAAAWIAAIAVGAAVALRLRAVRQHQERETGDFRYPNRVALTTFGAIAVGSYVILGLPVGIDRPMVDGTTYARGMSVFPEFASLALALTIYTGAYIAEIVRASIQALPAGQTEAAKAVGLSGYQRLTLVILPQALRQMIPSVTNQYLSANKNSSIALGVSYFDLFFVASIISNKIGHAVEVFSMIIVTYMILSLIISALMNILNARVTLHQV